MCRSNEIKLASCSVHEAEAPFDDTEPGLTVYLLSSDNVCFGVYKSILAKASPIFKDLFLLSTPSTDADTSRHGIPVIPMQEDAHTLILTLRLLYPVDNPALVSLTDVVAVLRTFDKFMIDSFPDTVSHALSSYISRQPLAVYALACQYHLSYVAAEVAKAALLLRIPTALPPELLDEHLQALQQYRRTCIRKVEARFLALEAQHTTSLAVKCRYREHWCMIPGGNQMHAVPFWRGSYHKDVMGAVHDRPRGCVAADTKIVGRYKKLSTECSECGDSAVTLLQSRSRYLESEIEKAVSQVPGPYIP